MENLSKYLDGQQTTRDPGVTYGLRGWYSPMANGNLHVVYVKNIGRKNEEEFRIYVEADRQAALNRILQVDLTLQDELCEYHDSKFSKTPKTAPLSPRKHRRPSWLNIGG